MTRRNSGDYAVVWPRSAEAVEIKPLARRLDTIEGKTIAFLWDDLFRGDEIWPILKQEFTRDERGFVITDANFETVSPGVFAIGAVRSGYGGRLTQAIAEATTAAERAATRCED